MKTVALLLILGLVAPILACQAGSPRSPYIDKDGQEIGLCWGARGFAVRDCAAGDKKQKVVYLPDRNGQIVVLAEKGVYEVTKKAVKVWNDELGWELLRAELLVSEEQAEMGNSHILVAKGGPNPFVAGVTFFIDAYRESAKPFPEIRKGGPHYHGMIIMHVSGPQALAVMAHELGHALGLAHDPENKRSLMFPNTSWALPKIEEQDLKILRARYAKYRRS